MIRGIQAELRKLLCPEVAGGMLGVAAFAVVLAAFGVRRATRWGDEAQAVASTLTTPSGALLGAIHQHVSISGVFFASLLVTICLAGEYRSGMLAVNLLFTSNRAVFLARKLVAVLLVMVVSVAFTAVALWTTMGILVAHRFSYFPSGTVAWTDSAEAALRGLLILLFFIMLAAVIAIGTKSMVPTMIGGTGLLAVTSPLATVPPVLPFLPHNWTATWMGLEDPWQFLTYFWPRADGSQWMSGFILVGVVVVLGTAMLVGFTHSERLCAVDD